MGYFKSFFGSSRDEIWSALRAQIGGELIPGTFWRAAAGPGGRMDSHAR